MGAVVATFAFLLAAVWALAERERRKGVEAERDVYAAAMRERLKVDEAVILPLRGESAQHQGPRDVIPFPARRA